MAVLITPVFALAIGLAAGCYAPEFRECIVACSSARQCAPGQICGTDGLCAGEALAGHCTPSPEIDASPGIDAAPAVDAPPPVELVVRVVGGGVVEVPPYPDCGGPAGAALECVYAIPYGVAVDLHAVPGPGAFLRWEVACKGEPTTTCRLVPTAMMKAEARFKD